MTTETDRLYRFYFDNTGRDAEITVHLLITYHTAEPGSVAPR